MPISVVNGTIYLVNGRSVEYTLDFMEHEKRDGTFLFEFLKEYVIKKLNAPL